MPVGTNDNVRDVLQRALRESPLELTLLSQMRAYVMPVAERQYKFHVERKWTLDFAWPDLKIAIECEGGTWAQGRHTRGVGYANDIEKYNELTVMGWRLLRFTMEHIKSGYAISTIQRLMGAQQ